MSSISFSSDGDRKKSAKRGKPTAKSGAGFHSDNPSAFAAKMRQNTSIYEQRAFALSKALEGWGVDAGRRRELQDEFAHMEQITYFNTEYLAAALHLWERICAHVPGDDSDITITKERSDVLIDVFQGEQIKMYLDKLASLVSTRVEPRIRGTVRTPAKMAVRRKTELLTYIRRIITFRSLRLFVREKPVLEEEPGFAPTPTAGAGVAVGPTIEEEDEEGDEVDFGRWE
jgi:hypothetical protein